jgi:hypothetical protein
MCWLRPTKQSRLAPAAALLGTIMLSSLMSSIGCARESFNPPAPVSFVYPLHVTIEQVSSAYRLDPVKADAEYAGKRLIFSQVTVEEVHRIYPSGGGPAGGGPGVTSYALIVDYFRAGGVRFELMDFNGIQQSIQAGYVLNVDGLCTGLRGELVDINECVVESIKGDLATGQPRGGY